MGDARSSSARRPLSIVPGATNGRVDVVIAALADITGVPPRAVGSGPDGAGSWLAQCPAHETTTGRTDNLTVSEGETGRVLLSCRGGEGCRPSEILRELWLDDSLLAPPSSTRRRRRQSWSAGSSGPPSGGGAVEGREGRGGGKQHKKQQTAASHEWGKTIDGASEASRWYRYVYRDAAGEPLFRVIRGECKTCDELMEREHGKRISQQTYIGTRAGGSGSVKDKRSWGKGVDVRLYTLYHLQEMIDGLEEGRPLWIVEGEKNVQSAEEAGLLATTAPGGALKWRDEYAALIAQYCDGNDIIIVQDNDEKGHKHAQMVKRSLVNYMSVGTVKIVRSELGHDLSDHIAVGGQLTIADGNKARAGPA